jgi:hypothetical protein
MINGESIPFKEHAQRNYEALTSWVLADIVNALKNALILTYSLI